MKKQNRDKTVPVAILIEPLIFYLFKVALVNAIKIVIKVNHANMLEGMYGYKFKSFLKPRLEDKNFGKAAI
ncbi:hypothetical protein GCM10023260_10730 [Bartonella acomydis]|uniref:Uncharacterized protein n=1 Tax=Bartonella acomydis TaxID=686234 RepID=A0ABP9MRU8_9HYPH